MPLQTANNATSRLASSITTSSTSISLQAGDGAKFPALTTNGWFPVTLIKADGQLEICRCTARSGDVLTVQRARENTTAKAFSSGDRVELRLTQAAIDAVQFPYSTALATGTDANSVTSPGVYYCNSDAQATPELNWPILLAGTLNVEAAETGNSQITQTYTSRNGTGGAVRKFVRVRFGGGAGTWGTWKEEALSLWDGTTLNLMPGGRFVEGNFDGVHAATTTSFRQGQPSTTVTYLPVVPPTEGVSAHVICRSAASENSAFVALGYNGTLGHGELTFSRHGTAASPGAFRFVSSVQECGRILSSGSWIFGPYLFAPTINACNHVYYTGGGTQYGTVYRPQIFGDGVAIQFQAYNGSVAGFIQSNSNLSVVYSTTSDYRSKTVLGALDGDECLANVMAMRPISFRMNGVAVVNKPLRGFIAHELQEVIPQAVTGHKDQTQVTPDGETVPVMQGVDLSKLVPDLVAAIQAQQRMIDTLKQQVEALSSAA